MEVIEIKHEFFSDNRLQCRACFSVGRTLRPLRDLSNTFMKITSEFVYPLQDSVESVLICWQCRSLLRKVIVFQEQVKRANELLHTNQSFVCGSLSNLTSVTLNDANITVYIYEGDIQTNKEPYKDTGGKNDINETIYFDDNPHENINRDNSGNDLANTENLDVKKQRSKSRWAIKRAQLNKKSKFKVSTNFDETFLKVHINNEELVRCIESERESEYFKSKQFTCDDCVLGFLDGEILAKHYRTFHSKKEKNTLVTFANIEL